MTVCGAEPGRWTNYATIHNMAIRPALGKDVALFLAHLSQSKTKTVCISAAAAISWNHTSRGLVSPCNDVIVKSALAGARRLFAAPIQRKEPFSLPLLRRLVNSLSPCSSLEDAQLTFYVVIAFFGLFRYSDIKQLRVKDFANNGQNLLVTLPCSKTNKFRAGANVYLSANTDEPLFCPVATSNRYFVKLAAAGCDKASLDVPLQTREIIVGVFVDQKTANGTSTPGGRHKRFYAAFLSIWGRDCGCKSQCAQVIDRYSRAMAVRLREQLY